MPSPAPTSQKIAIIGLGYVGLPLATAFGKKHATVGFDISAQRVAELQNHHDRTLEIPAKALREAKHLTFTNNPAALDACDIFIVTVPTPVDSYKRPDLSALKAACKTVGNAMKPGGLAIFESTVYPGATEEICVPIIEAHSKLRFNRDFHVGYSPERINPGDQQHRLETIVKVTSGSTPQAAQRVDTLYRSIVTAGTHCAPSIRVAEAAKVIENTQRDVNIALINELALLFHKLGIDTGDVITAAATKWNFLNFKPGLVGGHCIGVDPYYLTHKAQQVGHHPEVILAGRRINDGMGAHVAQRTIKLMAQHDLLITNARVLVLGLAFKQDCPDLRNTRVTDILAELQQFGIHADVYDPWVNADEAQQAYQITLLNKLVPNTYDAIILAVAHHQFIEMGGAGIRALAHPKGVIFDVQRVLERGTVDGRL